MSTDWDERILIAPQAAGSTSGTDVNELVLSLYDTVLAPEGWSIVLQRVADFLSGAGAVIFERPDGPGGRVVRASYMSAAYSATALDAYLARFTTLATQPVVLH